MEREARPQPVHWLSDVYKRQQVYATRMLLFGITDIFFITVFLGVASAGLHYELSELVVQFLFPLCVTACICFGILCSKHAFSETVAIVLCVIWSAVWIFIVLNENVYIMVTAVSYTHLDVYKRQTGEQNKERSYTMNKVLIIDDDKELCALIKRSVLSEDIEADFCNTGKEGLQKLKEKEYQLVILDVMMPGMDGFETLEEIRKENSLPILMFTSKNDSASKVRGLRAGADDYLTKPFDMDELIARIISLIRRYTLSLIHI